MTASIVAVRRALELQPSLADFLDRLTDEIAPSASALRARLAADPSQAEDSS
jgi:hypothetical protein